MRALRRERRHPQLRLPIAVRLTQYSLVQIVAFYGLLTLGVAFILGAALVGLDRDHSFGSAYRTALASLFSPGQLLERDGESLWFYVVGTGAALAAVGLPIFLLGSFVFKLFRHDPLIWRRNLTLEVHSSGDFVLAVRFYNGMRTDVADVRVRAWLRWRPSASRAEAENSNVPYAAFTRNRRLNVLMFGTADPQAAALASLGWAECDEYVTPLHPEALPTTVRIPLSPTSTDPLGPQGAAGDDILVQGLRAVRSNASLVLVADGVVARTGEHFTSQRTYGLKDDLQIELFQNVIVNDRAPKAWRGWDKFEETQVSYVFAYGSLLRRRDLARALSMARDEVGGEASAIELSPLASLAGWKRTWAVASDPAAQGRQYRDRTTQVVYRGCVVSLGLEPDAQSQVHGVLVRVGYRALAEMDRRERDYDRIEVSDAVSAYGLVRPADDLRVFTYVQKPAAQELFAGASELAVRDEYYHGIRESLAALPQERGRTCGRVPAVAWVENFDSVPLPDAVAVLPLDIEVVSSG